MNPLVRTVSKSLSHSFSKIIQEEISLIEGEGIEGDAHKGVLVKHRSRVRKDPTQPNLRQVHLIQSELFDELKEKGYDIFPGQIGENITTANIDLLGLPKGTKLSIGKDAQVELTGLRNPCYQLDDFQQGLMKKLIEKDPEGQIIRKAGVMGIVTKSGRVIPGDSILVSVPPEPHTKLERV